MAILRHSQLPSLPRLLDCLYSSTVPHLRADPFPSSGTSLCDPRGGGGHDDLLVCWIHCDGISAAPAAVVSFQYLQLAPGSNNIWGL
jgi:hypothetical protein